MQKFALKLTAAVVLDGDIKTAKTIVHVDKATAQNLLQRGRAEVATEADEVQTEQEAETVVVQEPAADAQPEPAAEVATEAAKPAAAKTTKAKAK